MSEKLGNEVEIQLITGSVITDEQTKKLEEYFVNRPYKDTSILELSPGYNVSVIKENTCDQLKIIPLCNAPGCTLKSVCSGFIAGVPARLCAGHAVQYSNPRFTGDKQGS